MSSLLCGWFARALLPLLIVLCGLPPGLATAAAPSLSAFPRSAQDPFKLRLEGEAGSNYMLEVSWDLSHWLPLHAEEATNGVIEWLDPQAIYFPRGFYRARVASAVEVPHPLAVIPGLDPSLSVTSLLARAGGTVALTNRAGAVFTLTIPTNAILSEAPISMTPVTNVQGLPLSGGLVAAVELGPEGLFLLEPASLRIDKVGPLTNGGLLPIGFGYRGSGKEFHLCPVQVNGTTASFQLLHFSGHGVGNGTSADVQQQQQQHPPSQPSDRAEQDMAAGESLDMIYAELLAMGSAVSAESLAAVENEVLLDHAYTQFVIWLALVRSTSLEPRFRALILAIEQNIGAGLINAVQRAYLQCASAHDLGQITRIVRLVAWAQIKPELLPWVGDLQALRDLARQCARFELSFDSTMEAEETSGSFTAQVQSQVLLTLLDFQAPTFSGSAPLDYVLFTGTAACPLTTTTSGSTLLVVNGSIDLNLEFDPSFPYVVPPNPTPRILLPINPGQPTEVVTEHCPGGPPVSAPTAVWFGSFGSQHQGELVGGLYEIPAWSYPGGDVLARKVYHRTAVFEGVTSIEQTTLELRHQP